MKLELNLSEKLYVKQDSNQFNPQYKNYGRIMRIIQHRVDKMMVYHVKRIDKRFHINHVVPANQGVFVADEAGRVFYLLESSFSNFVTTHQMRISSMFVDIPKRTLITASEARDIKIIDMSSFRTNVYIVDVPSVVRCIVIDHERDVMYASLDNGYIIGYSIIDGETVVILPCNSNNTPILSLALNHDNSIIFAGDFLGNIYAWDLETPLLIKVFQASPGSINFMLFNISENAFYSADSLGQIMIWNATSFELISEFGVSKSSITRLIISEEKRLIVGCNIDGSVMLWDLETKAFIKYFREFKLKGLRDIALSQDESQLYAVGFSDHAENWDFNKNSIITRLYTNEIFDNENYPLIYSTANKMFCVSSTNNVLVYNIIDHLGNAELYEQFSLPGKFKFTSVTIDESSPIMYLGCTSGDIQIWNYETKSYLKSFNCGPNAITTISFKEETNKLFCGDAQGAIFEWDLNNDTKVKEIPDSSDSSIKFVFTTQNGSHLIVGRENGIIQLRDREHGTIVMETNENHVNGFNCFCKAKAADTFYTASDDRFLIKWTILNETIISKVVLSKDNLPIKNMTCNYTGSLVFMTVSDNRIKVYDDNYQLPQTFYVRVNVDISYISLTPDASTLFMFAEDGSLYYVNIMPKHNFEFLSKTSPSVSTCICADNDNIYIGNQNGSIDVWSLATKDLFIKFTTKQSRVNCMLLSSRGRYLYTGHEDGGIVIWNTENYTFIREFRKQEGGITSLIMNHDQKLLLSAGKDNKVFIWDLRNYTVKYWITTQFEPEQICLSTEDKYLIIKLVTGQVALYNLAGENLGYIGNRTPTLRSIAISRDGNKIYMAYEDQPIQIWDLSDFEAIGILYKPKAPLEAMNISQRGNRMYIITRDGVLSIIDINTKSLVKEVDFLEPFTCSSIYILPRKNILLGLGYNKTLMIDINDNYSYYEKLYVHKALMNYNSIGAEADFVTTLEYVKTHYNSSFILRTFFNAIFVCALFNYQSAIQIIQNQQLASYPQDNDHNQISPIVLALKLRNFNLVQLVLKNISKNATNFIFSYKEIKELLKSKYGFTHKYIKDSMINLKTFTDSTLKVPTLSRIDEKVRMDYDLNSYFSERRFEKMTEPRHLYKKKATFNFDQALKKIKENFGKSESVDLTADSFKANAFISLKKLKSVVKDDRNEDAPKQNKAPWKPTKFYRLNAYYSFKEGSSDSLYFLKNYVNSNSSDFVLSNWRFIIDYKWNLVYWYLIPAALLNFVHVVLYSLYLIKPQRFAVFLAEAVVMGLLIFYELLSFIITGKEHFDDFYNVLDSIFLSFTVAIFVLTRYFIVEKEETDLDWLKYLQVLTLFMVYYRSVTYLRVVKYFRHLIDMIIGVTGSTISLLIIIAYSIVAFSVMFQKAIGSANYSIYLKENFYALLGELTDYSEEDRGITILGWIIFTIMVIFIPLILINFLIAKMSNKYTELESNEKVTSYKEKAKMIMEIEFYFRIKQRTKDYKYFTFIARKTSKLKDSEENLEEKLENNIENLHNRMNEIKVIRQNEIKEAVMRQIELEQQIKDILSENNLLKNQLNSIREENTELKSLLSERDSDLDARFEEINKKLAVLANVSASNDAGIKETK